MAFTPDGMFYLSQEDYAPTMDVLGGAARGMLGLQNKEEAIQSILQGADYDTPEGRRAALEQIRVIDPTAWEKYARMNDEFEQSGLRTRELKTKVIKGENEPLVKQRWNLEGKGNYILEHATSKLAGMEGYDDLISSIQLQPKRAEFFMNRFLNKLEKGDDKAALKAEFKSGLKQAKTNYMDFWLPKEGLGKEDKKVTDPKFTETPSTEGSELKDPPTGTTSPTELYKPNPEQSQLRQGFGEFSSGLDLWKGLQSVQGDLTGFMPEFLMTDAELEIENIRDDIGDWIDEGTAAEHFKKYPASEFYKFKKDPVAYWHNVIKKKTK